MNIRDLEYIVAVARHRSFRKAAFAVAVSQPALSMQIAKLEDELSVKIFERTHKAAIVTPEGQAIIALAREILDKASDIVRYAQSVQDPYARKIRVGIFPTLAPYLLPKIIPVLKSRFPHMMLSFIEEKTVALIDRLERGEIDVVFSALPLIAPTLEFRLLFTEDFYLAVSLSHPLASCKRVSAADIAGESLLLLEDGHCLRDQALEVCSLYHAEAAHDFTATSLETLRQIIAASGGMTLIPKIAVNDNAHGVRYIPFIKPAPHRSIALAWRPSSPFGQVYAAIAETIAGMDVFA